MSHARRVTLREKRREMQELMLERERERQRRKPVRVEPDWIRNVWAERRRMLT